MRFKHMIIILIFFCFVLSFSSVSASDNACADNITMVDGEIILKDSKSIENIDDLDNEIQNAAPNSTIKLENDIIVNQDAKCGGIEIFENIIFDGQGHKIDGNSADMDFLLRIHGDNVVLKNTVFTNWDITHSYNLIEWIGANGQMKNCTFINNTAIYGGAVDWTGINGLLINCTFINNSAENGGGLYWYGIEGTIGDCIFFNNTAEIGGAVFITGRDTKLDNSKFRINSADDIGGAVYADGLNFVLSKCDFANNTAVNGGAVYTISYPNLIYLCNFTDNSADETAGAVYLSSANNTVRDSIFRNNSANNAGAIYCDVNDDLYVLNSKFYNNSAQELGGAIMVDEYANIVNSTFDGNNATTGGAIYSDSETEFINSTFSNNKAINGGALAVNDGQIVNSSFVKNFANETGGAIYVSGDFYIDNIYFNENTAGNASNNIYLDDAHVTRALDMKIGIRNITFGDTLRIKVTMPNNITEGMIIVDINGERLKTNLTSSQTTIKIPNLNIGSYYVELFYEGNEYNSTTSNYIVDVLEKSAPTSSTSFGIKIVGKTTLAVKGKNEKTTAGEKLTIYINNKKIKTVTSNNTGVSIVTLTESKLESLKAFFKTLKDILTNNYKPYSKSIKITSNNEKKTSKISSISTDCAENINDTQILRESKINEGLENTQNSILKEDSSDLSKIINSASAGSTVKLNKSYTPANHINIDKSLTIDGAGNTIDCSKAQLRSSSGDITLKNLKFINGNSFNGGAIYITGSAKFTIINCTFTNNKANSFGGAIYNNVVGTLTIKDCKFTGNDAKITGGAIFSKGNIVVEKSVFENNQAKVDGGAVHSEKSVEISNSIFNSNKVTGHATYGGAINVKKDAFIENSTFNGNSADMGGAIFSYSDLIIENSQFIKNTAREGGAIKVTSDSHIYIENSTFKQNSATSEGGGAIYSNKWTHVGNSIFELNTANHKGGAIETDYIQFSGKNTFTNNSAKDHGGAIYTNNIGSDNNNLIFNGNHVDADFGGAIYINKKSGDIRFTSSVFTNNHANAGDGGAVYSDSSSTNLFFTNCTFTSNYATGGKERRYGGAVRSCGNINVNNCTFKDNWAENYGGAIYTETASEIKNSVFISNQVKNGGTRYGGALYVNKATQMTISGNYFEKNGGGSHGGVLYTDSMNAHIKLTNNAFIENSASEQGVSVYNCGYYDDISNNWWGINKASIANQLKEYHKIGSNDDKYDSKPLSVSIVADKDVYSGVKTTIKVSFTGPVTYYVLDTLKYSSNKKGEFITKKINADSLELIYVPDEIGTHKLDFTINSQNLSYEMNVKYISVYGYDITKTYGDDSLYSAVFKDKNGKYLPKGTKVNFNVNNVNYTSQIADDNGAAVLYATFEPGTYAVKAMNPVTGESYTNKITVNKRNIVFDINEPYIIKLNASANKTVTFKVESKTFTGTTSEDGYAYFLLNVTAGNHTVETIYNGKTIKDYITVSNRYATIDLGLSGTSYGAMLPVYSNETFKTVSNTTVYSVIGENTYRYIMTSGDAFILYNVTVSNSQELTNVLRKMARKDYKVDVTIINLKKNTYKISDHFWEDSDWKYLVHLNHGTLIINGGGSTLEDDYKHNFASLDSNTNIMVTNLEFKKFYRVFANNGEVYCENSTFTQNDAQKWATTTKGSVIYNKNKATFKNCIFNGNENGGKEEHNRGGVLYADSNSLTNFISCSFKTKTDTVRAVEKSMVVVYDTIWDAYNHIKYNGYIDNNASLSIRNVYTLTHNMTKNLYATNMTGLQDATEWIDSFNNITSFNITLSKGQYVINANDLKKYRDSQDWRSRTIEGAIGVVHQRSFIDVNSKPVVINGNGATIKMTGNDANDDYHFAYIPKYGSLTLINLTLSGFNTAIENYGTFIAINCTFIDNINHHIIKVGDYGGAIRNFGTVFCSDSIFKNNGANQGGAYYGFGISSNAIFSNCLFTGNVIKSNLAWKNNDKNDLDIQNLAVVKLVNCKGYSSSTINTEKGGIYMVRESLNDTVYNVVVDNLASLMKASKIVNGNTKYDVINITFAEGEYGLIPNSQSLFQADYGLLLINGAGAKAFVQNPHDDDTTQFLTVASRGNVRINELTMEGFNIAIENSGKLLVIHSIFNNNKVDYKFKADYGGAIVNKGSLTVFNSTFTNNYGKYAGAIYSSGNAVIIQSTFSANRGYHESKNVDIYNKDGSVDDIIISGPDHSYVEQHPIASWKMDLIESGVLLATIVITANVGYSLAVAAVPAAGLVATLASAGIGGALGTILGAVYTSEYQDPSLFWNGVLKGMSNGLKVASFGGAAYSIPFKIATKFMVAGVNHVISKGLAASVKITQSVLNYCQRENKIIYFT